MAVVLSATQLRRIQFKTQVTTLNVHAKQMGILLGQF